MIKLLAGLLVLFLPAAAWSAEVRVLENNPDTLSVEVTSDYILGDGDSRVDGRNLALEAAKRAAAEAAGSYVEAEVVFADDRVEKERITTFSAAFLKTRILEELLALTPEGRMKMTLKVQATLDKQDLRRRVVELREQPQKQKQIEDLQKSNTELRRELASLNAQLQAARTAPAAAASAAGAPKPRPELAERRDVVLSRIEQNEAAMRRVFEKGTLASLARQAEGAYEKAKADVDTHVLGYLVHNLQVTMGEPRFRKSGAELYEIEVPVTWTIDPKPIVQTLNRYFWGQNRKPLDAPAVRWYANSDDSRKESFSADLFNYLVANPAAIVVKAGKYSQPLFISGKNRWPNERDFIILTQGKAESKLKHSDSNPVVIKSVRAADLESITALEARVEIVRP